ncbi:MAG: glycosyltransferase [Thermoproteota archaeon]
MLRVVAVMHGLGFGGAQIATLEFINLLSNKIMFKILTCEEAVAQIVNSLKNNVNVDVYKVPCSVVMGYPVMSIEGMKKLIDWADVVWITDIEYSVASRIKRTRKVPVVAHIHSYALICPWWGASYRFSEICLEGCSVWRLISCKQGINMELRKVSILDGFRARAYWLMDFVKGPMDYVRWRGLMENAVDDIDYFIAVSDTTKEIISAHLPKIKDRVEVLYNAIAQRPWRYVSSFPDEPGDYVLYASGANPVKGPHILLNALKILLNEGIDMKLYMTGASNSWLEGLARRLGVEGWVKFLGRLPDAEYFSMMAKAKALVLPSIWPEPLPSVAIESISLGVPVVGSNRGGIPEIVGNYGITTNPTPEEVAKAISTIIEQRFDKHEMKRYAAQKFGEGNAEKFLQILSTVKVST